MKNLISIFGLVFCTSAMYAQTLDKAVSWGGAEYEVNPRLAVDDDGNIYVAGFFKGSIDFDPGPGTTTLESGFDGFINDGYISKFNSSGVLQWVIQLQASIGLTITDIIVKRSNNIVVTGSYWGTVDFEPGPGTYFLSSKGDSYDAFVLELDWDGNFNHVIPVASGSGTESARTVAEAENGDIIVTGIYTGTSDLDPGQNEINHTAEGINDIFISRMSGETLVWTRTLQGNYQAASTSLAMDSEGYVYVTGIFDDRRDFDPGPDSMILVSNLIWDAFILKLDPNGNFVRVHQLGLDGDDEINAVMVDEEDNVYVAGYFSEEIDLDPGSGTAIFMAQNFDPFVLKLSPDGAKIWAIQFTGISFDQIRSMDLDHNGNLYVTGWYGDVLDIDPGPEVHHIRSTGANDNNDVFVVKLDEDGQLIWGHTAGGLENDYGEDILLDQSNHIYIAGTFFGLAGFDPEGFSTDSLQSNGSGDFFLAEWMDCLLNLEVEQQDEVLASLHVNADSYQWLHCDQNFLPVSGAQSQTFQPTVSGQYAVVLTEGTCTDTSECITYMVSSTEEGDDGSAIRIYPNPSDGNLFLESAISLSGYVIVVRDIAGRMVLQKQITEPVHLEQFHDLINGIYLIEVRNSRSQYTFRLIVQ